MKRTILLLSAILFVVDGCVKTEISDHLGTPTIIRLHQAIAVIPYPLTRNLRIDSYWYPHWRSQTEVADCLVSSMKSVEPKLKFIERDSFRDALYPWFAPSTAPKSLKELASVMKNPLVKERMSNIGVRFVILVTGYTIERDFIGAGIYIVAVVYPPDDNIAGISLLVQTIVMTLAGFLFFVGRKNFIDSSSF